MKSATGKISIPCFHIIINICLLIVNCFSKEVFSYFDEVESPYKTPLACGALSFMYLSFLFHQCSTSCGEGTQTRSAVCQKVLKTGVSTVVNSTLCPPLPFSSSIRPCMLAACASEYARAQGTGSWKNT